MSSIAIDFGTSNCSAHVAQSTRVLPIRLDRGDFILPSVVFTSRREVALRQIQGNEFAKRLSSARAEQVRIKAAGGLVTDPKLLESAIRDAMRREAIREADKAYWDQTFFSILKSGQAIMFGTPALHAYLAIGWRVSEIAEVFSGKRHGARPPVALRGSSFRHAWSHKEHGRD